MEIRSTFDMREIYQEKIEPQVKQLRAECYKYGIPMIAVFAVKDDGEMTEYVNTMVSAGITDRTLTNNRISDIVNVIAGFRTVPLDKPMELDFDVQQEE